MTSTPKVHYPDSIFGRPCCGNVSDAVVRDLARVDCRRCRRIVEECERATAQREAVAHG